MVDGMVALAVGSCLPIVLVAWPRVAATYLDAWGLRRTRFVRRTGCRCAAWPCRRAQASYRCADSIVAGSAIARRAVSRCVVVGLMLVAATAHAGDASEPVLEEQRVTATALPLTPATASPHVTILRRADLDALRGQDLATILARQAGIVIDRGARSGGYGALYLRGADPSHVVVLVDHVRQNDPLSSRGSAVDLNTLSVDDVERIEIVRGNASVANAEAVAGLIHVFTRRATSGRAAGGALGGDGLRSAHASWAADGPRLGASWREDGDRADGYARTRAVNASWDADVEALSLRVAVRLADSAQRGFPDDSGGQRYAVQRALDARDGETRQLSLRGEYAAAAGTLDLHAATLSRDGEESTPGVAPGLRDPAGLPPIVSRSDYTRDEVQAAWRRSAGDAVLLTLGTQYQREHGRLDSLIDFGAFALPAAFALSRDTASAFGEARWQSGPWAVQGGVRHERYDGDASAQASSATHPMLSLQRSVGERGGSWGASVARASKPPSFYALGHPLVGNPQLKAETAQQRELYYATAEDAAWAGRVTLFSARYRDLIDFDAGPPPQLVNRDRIGTDGIEWRASRRFGNDWRLQLDGTWMRVRDPDGGVPLRHRPKIQAAAQLGVPVGERRELSLLLRHLGRRFDSSIPTGDVWLSASTTVDLVLRQQFGAAQLLLALDNAGNARSEETLGMPLPGRRLRLALDWRLP